MDEDGELLMDPDAQSDREASLGPYSPWTRTTAVSATMVLKKTNSLDGDDVDDEVWGWWVVLAVVKQCLRLCGSS